MTESFGTLPAGKDLNPAAAAAPVAPPREPRTGDDRRGRIEVTADSDGGSETDTGAPTVQRPFTLNGLFGNTTLKERNKSMRIKNMDKDGSELDNAIRIITGKFPSMLNHPALLAKARDLARNAGRLDDIEAWFQEEMNKNGSEVILALQQKFKETWPYFGVTDAKGNRSGIVSCRIGKRKLSDHLTAENYMISKDASGNTYFYDGKSVSVKLRGAVQTKDGTVPAEQFGKAHAEYMMTALVLDYAGKKNPDGTPKDYSITVSAGGLFRRAECRDLCLLQTLKVAHETGSMASLTMKKGSLFGFTSKLDKINIKDIDTEAMSAFGGPDVVGGLIEAYNNRRNPAAASPAPTPDPDAEASPTVSLRRTPAAAAPRPVAPL